MTESLSKTDTLIGMRRRILKKLVRDVAPLHKSLNPGPGGRIRLRAKINFSISPTLENFVEI